MGTEQINQASPPAYIIPPGRFSLLYLEQPPSNPLQGRHPRLVAISLDSMIHIQRHCPKSTLAVVSLDPHPHPTTRCCMVSPSFLPVDHHHLIDYTRSTSPTQRCFAVSLDSIIHIQRDCLWAWSLIPDPDHIRSHRQPDRSKSW